LLISAALVYLLLRLAHKLHMLSLVIISIIYHVNKLVWLYWHANEWIKCQIGKCTWI